MIDRHFERGDVCSTSVMGQRGRRRARPTSTGEPEGSEEVDLPFSGGKEEFGGEVGDGEFF